VTNASACCIVLVNWNNWRDTVACIESCKELRGAAFHIVVVDNGSHDESPLEIARRHPDVQILRLPTNEGFAAGCNAGIKFAVAAGDACVWLLNNDTRVDPDALDALVQDMASHPCAGIVGSKILNWEEPDKLSFAVAGSPGGPGDRYILVKGSWTAGNMIRRGMSSTAPARACL